MENSWCNYHLMPFSFSLIMAHDKVYLYLVFSAQSGKCKLDKDIIEYRMCYSFWFYQILQHIYHKNMKTWLFLIPLPVSQTPISVTSASAEFV